MPEPVAITLAGLSATRAQPAGEPVARLLFVHGFLGHHRQFDGWLRRLSGAGFDCYAVSVRGRDGVPPEAARGATLDQFADDVTRVLRELGPDTVLVGHSLGALLACRAVAETGKAAGLVLLAPGPERAYVPAPGLLPALPWLMPRVLAGRSLRAPLWVVRQIAFNRVPANEQAELHGAMVADSGRAYRTFLLGAGLDRSRIRCPVLVIAGRDDRVIPVRVARGLARRLGGELRVLDGHAHWLPSEPGWEAIADSVAAWVRERTGVAAAAS